MSATGIRVAPLLLSSPTPCAECERMAAELLLQLQSKGTPEATIAIVTAHQLSALASADAADIVAAAAVDLVEGNRRIVLLSVPPCGEGIGSPADERAQGQKAFMANNALRKLVSNDVCFLDLTSKLEDPQECLLKADCDAGDGIHLSSAALEFIAQAVHRRLTGVPVFCFGDSLTAGYTYTAMEGGGHRLDFKPYSAFLEEASSGHLNVDYEGHCGERTEQLQERLAKALKKLDFQPKYVVLLAGTNDVADIDHPATWEIETSGIANRVAAMVDLVLARPGAPVPIVLTIPPLGPPLRGKLADAVISDSRRLRNKTNRALKKAVRSRAGAIVVDLYSAVADFDDADELLQSRYVCKDGLHLSEDGYRCVAQLVAAAIARPPES